MAPEWTPELTVGVEKIDLQRRFSSWRADHIGRTDKVMGAFLLKQD